MKVQLVRAGEDLRLYTAPPNWLVLYRNTQFSNAGAEPPRFTTAFALRVKMQFRKVGLTAKFNTARSLAPVRVKPSTVARRSTSPKTELFSKIGRPGPAISRVTLL